MSLETPLLELTGIHVVYDMGRGQKIPAVSGVDLHLIQGETLGLVGESGCGKSSVARAVMQLPKPTSGRVMFRGQNLTGMQPKELRQIRPQFQMVFQDSVSALNPRRPIGKSIAKPLNTGVEKNKIKRQKLAMEMMQRVGLDPSHFNHRPHQFSGGQCQRIQIARALMTRPKLLVCDEPVSSLDVSIQAQILNLLEDLRKQYGLTMLFISHDLTVIKNVSDRVAVMYLGKVCEIAPCENLFSQPAHPYTAALLSAIPKTNPTGRSEKIKLLDNEIPSPLRPPSGCRFRTRCPKTKPVCASSEPVEKTIRPGHVVACHLYNN